MREGAQRWVFYEGPPTANGPPGSHHVLSRVFKDIYPRFQTMRGRYVERKGGWDCHGLPVEIAVEQQLGISSKAEIEERVGIERFNAECRASVFTFLEDWNRLTERIGFWIDLDDAYRTLDESYIESVWWALAQIHAGGLLYEGNKVVPYCPRCETTLSSHEVALGYRDVVDPSVFLKLPLAGGEDRLLVWTTTPWTLPGNVALAVAPAAAYVRARVGADTYVLAEDRLADVLGEGVEVLERFSGEELVSRYCTYEGPIFAATDREPGELPILADAFVTTADGTGIVHLAPAFGEEDYRVAASSPRVPFDATRAETLYNPVRPDGTYDARVRDREGRSFEGRFVKDAALTAELIEDLDAAGAAAQGRGLRARLPPLLALRHAAALLRETVVVHRHLAAAGGAARRQRHGCLASAARQGGALRRVAEEQRRLGALARALLGNAAARVALPPGPRARGRIVRRAGGALGARARRPPPAVRRRAELPLPARGRGGGLRGADAPRARGDRRVVRLGRDAVRAAPLPVRERAGARARLPRRLHLRGAGPDARLVLLAARRLDAARLGRPLPQRGVPRADPRRGGSEDVEVAREHGGAVAGPRTLWRGRLPLVLLHVQAAVGRIPLLARDDRRGRAAVPEAAVVDVLLLRALCERRRRAAARAGLRAPRAGSRRARPRPLGDVAHRGDRGARVRAPRGVRRDERRSRDLGARGRALQLVCAPLAPALLGRRSRCVPHAARVPARRLQDARAVLPLRLRRDLRQPRRLARERPPLRLPHRRRARRPRGGARAGDGARARDGTARAGRPWTGQDQGAPAAGRGRRRRRRARAGGDRTSRRCRARRAQRQARALRSRRR